MAITSNQQGHERKVSALKRARVIWGKTADSSKEAAHATKVLDVILARVSTSSDVAAGTESPSRTKDGGRRFTAASTSSENVTGSTPSPADLRQYGTPAVQVGWMAVNYAGGPSKEWDFGFDNADRRLSAGKSGDQLGLFLGNDVDWVRLSVFTSCIFFFSPFLIPFYRISSAPILLSLFAARRLNPQQDTSFRHVW